MLKAFRNWWENSKYYFNNAIQARWTLIGWKAALRWVLRSIEEGNGDVVEFIKKEIENG